jgi:hypothetical protein
MKFRTSQIIPLVSSLGKYLQLGMDSSWDPKIKKITLMDDSTRKAGARFLAGVAVAIASA